MIFIRINVDHEEKRTIIEEKEISNVFMIENVFSKRKSDIEELYIDV